MGHGVLMIQKQQDTRLAENKSMVGNKHEELKFTTLIINPGTAAIQCFLITVEPPNFVHLIKN